MGLHTIPRTAIFASGNGTNAENIIKHSQIENTFEVVAVFCNNPDAFVLQRAKGLGVEIFIFSKEQFQNTSLVFEKLKELEADWIILAGFLLLVPDNIVKKWNNKIINIHPALLPNFGGKGMYGMNVHNAVIESGEKQSGITIHFVNDRYDEGDIVFQAICEVTKDDTPETLALKVHELEYKYFPEVISQIIC
jgi:phosphoribosylglycinamide formyltransferase 1